MKLRLLFPALALLLLLTSCAQIFYQKYRLYQPVGLDFSQGRWLIGNINANRGMNVELADIAMADFSKHAGGRVKSAVNEPAILVAAEVPLDPGKNEMEDLKKATGFDYYINIKCESLQKKESSLHFKYPINYTKEMTHGIVTLEVYDLNNAEIIFSQTIAGKSDENMALTNDLSRMVILKCYKKIFKEIEKKYT